jgi:hypothetical protein
VVSSLLDSSSSTVYMVSPVGGAICCFFLPEYPYNAKLLTPLERQVAVYRLEKEAGAGEGSEDIGTWQGFKIGLKDIKVSNSFQNMNSADR